MRFLKYVDKYSGSWLPWRWSGRSERVSAASRSMAISSRPISRADVPGPAASARTDTEQLCLDSPVRLSQGTGSVRGAELCTDINALLFALSVLSLFCKRGVSYPLNSITFPRFQEKPRIMRSWKGSIKTIKCNSRPCAGHPNNALRAWGHCPNSVNTTFPRGKGFVHGWLKHLWISHHFYYTRAAPTFLRPNAFLLSQFTCFWRTNIDVQSVIHVEVSSPRRNWSQSSNPVTGRKHVMLDNSGQIPTHFHHSRQGLNFYPHTFKAKML